MHNFMADEDRRSMLFERQLNYFDRAINARAKTAWGGEQDVELRFGDIWFSHRQCHLGKDRAKAKDFPVNRRKMIAVGQQGG
jgi:hypothetical protein